MTQISNSDAGLLTLSRRLDQTGDVGWTEDHRALSSRDARALVASRSFPEGCDMGNNHVAVLELFSKAMATAESKRIREYKNAKYEAFKNDPVRLAEVERRRKEELKRVRAYDAETYRRYFDREYEGT